MSERFVEDRLYPETGAGGFPHVDHRMSFLVRVHAVLTPDMTVMDLGAGRGKWGDDPAPFRRALGDLRGKCRRIFGVDVDEAVRENRTVDEAIVWRPSDPLPFSNDSLDMVTAFSVFEHVEDAAWTAAELERVLRPGGWIVAWTPNRYGYVAFFARIVPRRLHRAILRLVEPRRHEVDSFVPLYRLNSRSDLRSLFPPERWEHFSYAYNGQPFYHGERMWLARFWLLTFRLLPRSLSSYLMVILRKR